MRDDLGHQEDGSLLGRYLEERAHPEGPETRLLHQEWLTAQHVGGAFERNLPRRIDLNMRKLGPILSKVYLFDIVNEGTDFQVRLLGGDTAALIGANPAGQLLSSIDGSEWRMAIMEAVYQHAQPQTRVVEIGPADGSVAVIETAAFPVCDRYGRFNLVIGAFSRLSGFLTPPPAM